MSVCRVLMSSLLMFVALGPARALAQSAPAYASSMRDVLQTMDARLLLANEPELAGMNIGVTIRNRVATLWGPVPSAEAIFRAELSLRTMIELTKVENELFVGDHPDEALRSKPAPRTPTFQPIAPNRLPPRLPIDPLSLVPMPDLGVPVQVGPAIIKAAPEATAPNSDGVTDNDRAVVVAVRALLLGKANYREVRFAVRDGRVYLKAQTPGSPALHDAAREISRLPGVEGVILLEKSR